MVYYKDEQNLLNLFKKKGGGRGNNKPTLNQSLMLLWPFYLVVMET